MRILVVLALLAFACASKKASKTPANVAPAGDPKETDDERMRDKDRPDDPDEMPKDGADPCDGGE